MSWSFLGFKASLCLILMQCILSFYSYLMVCKLSAKHMPNFNINFLI